MRPLVFRPLLKRIRWGGRRLGTVLGKPIGDATDYAESWEVADHGDDQSVVLDGPLQNDTLGRIVAEHNDELFGRHAGLRQFPLLIKFLDATDRLSLQVHPDDRQAARYSPQENGKTEAWVILSAEPGSRIYAGLRPGVDRSVLQRHIETEQIESVVHSYEVREGDCVFVPAGTVHAIGEGILLAEIQQQSDLTFRLHDWGRTGADGRPRELHLDQSLGCIDFTRGPVDKVAPRIAASGDHVLEVLVESDFFVIKRHTATVSVAIDPENRFHVLLVVGGAARLTCDGDVRRCPTGTTILIPAVCPSIELQPDPAATILHTHLP